ncbi:MAG TPA: hypothetical protein PLD22_00815 [Bacillota bacterium]|jgi:hypothetical protein|nr:hypothetical protein [Clostridiales bacterium UBA9856]HOA41991.1 hypothetical protein [Bacillota bacterium]HPZ59319.1 hypothetical protein [Bacillota bacterium]HQC81853.1 hypothetical protein [Bacillota bacterium]
MSNSNMDVTMDEIMSYEPAYPEIYYKVQPFIMEICDQLEAYGGTMPSMEVIERLVDSIYTDLLTMYPDLSEYAGGDTATTSVSELSGSQDYAQPVTVPFFRRRFRRRGLFRDFIQILLLNEIFRRL